MLFAIYDKNNRYDTSYSKHIDHLLISKKSIIDCEI